MEHSWNTPGTLLEHSVFHGVKVWEHSGTLLENPGTLRFPCGVCGMLHEIQWNTPGTLLEHSVFLGVKVWEHSGTLLENPGTLRFLCGVCDIP